MRAETRGESCRTILRRKELRHSTKGTKMNKCVFCSRENYAESLVYEDAQAAVFYDIDPINAGHLLLIPKEHYLDLDELPPELLLHLMQLAQRLVAALRSVYAPQGYSVLQNGGACNDIGHFHLHIVPRYEGDGFGWTGGTGAASEEEQRRKLQSLLTKEE